MNVIKRTVTTYTLSDSTDQVIMLGTFEDLGNGAGRCSMQEGSQNHTAYWNNLSGMPVEEFFRTRGLEFLMGCFDPFGTLHRKVEPETVRNLLAAELERQQAAGEITAERNGELLARFGCFAPVSDITGIQALCMDLMKDIFGPMWAESARTLLLGQHPHYLGLRKRIETLQSVLTPK